MANKLIGEGQNLSRRYFVVGSLAAGAGFALGFNVPLGIDSAAAQSAAETGAEVNAWVVVKPDETCVIRIARTEMGQGTRTGLAQLVAAGHQCDRNKVTTDTVTPGVNVERKRVGDESG